MKTDSELLSCVPLTMIGAAKTGYAVSASGGEGGGDGYNGPFRFSGTAIENCILFFGRTQLTCDDVPCTEEQFRNSYVYAVVAHGGGNPTLSVEIKGSDTSVNSLSKTYRLLYYPDGEQGVVDCRFAPVIFATE